MKTKHINKATDYEFLAELFDPVTKKTKDIIITVIGGRLLVQVEGYGDRCSSDGDGEPIMLDYNDGKLEAIIWSDVNEEDPTHIIDLEKARESNRAETDDNDNCIYCGKKCYKGEMCDEQQAGGFNKDHNKAMASQEDD